MARRLQFGFVNYQIIELQIAIFEISNDSCNTCFMNSILQCLIHIKKYYQYFKQDQHFIQQFTQYSNKIYQKMNGTQDNDYWLDTSYNSSYGYAQCTILIGVNTDNTTQIIANKILLLSEQCNGEYINLNVKHYNVNKFNRLHSNSDKSIKIKHMINRSSINSDWSNKNHLEPNRRSKQDQASDVYCFDKKQSGQERLLSSLRKSFKNAVWE